MRRTFLLVAASLAFNLLALAQTPTVEVFGGYSTIRQSSTRFGTTTTGTLNGWSGSFAGNINGWFGIVGDVDAHYGKQPAGFLRSQLNGDYLLYTYRVGPRFSFRQNSKVVPYIQAIAGGARLSVHGSRAGSTIRLAQVTSGPSGAAGGGIDVIAHRHLAVRIIQAEFNLLKLTQQAEPFQSRGMRLSFGAVGRF